MRLNEIVKPDTAVDEGIGDTIRRTALAGMMAAAPMGIDKSPHPSSDIPLAPYDRGIDFDRPEDLVTRLSPQQLTTSHEGVERIADFEKFRAKPYIDVKKKKAIGYGHQIQKGERFTKITEPQARRLLSKDIRWAERAIRDAVRVPLAQSQFDALVSFVFNVGRANFLDSTLLRRLNIGDHHGVADEMRKWTYARGKQLDGLVSRRNQEAQVWLATVPDSSFRTASSGTE